MSFLFLSLREIARSVESAVLDKIPELEAQENSVIKALAYGYSVGLSAYEQIIKEAIDQNFAHSSSGAMLDRVGRECGVIRRQATKAAGFVTATGDINAEILAGQELKSPTGNVYTIKQSEIVSNVSLSAEWSIIGRYLYFTFEENHPFYNGQNVEITASSEPNMIGTFAVEPVNNRTLKIVQDFIIDNSSGTATLSANIASLYVESNDFGASQNIRIGELSFSSTIAGVDDAVFVQVGGISGGSDEATDDEYRSRILLQKQNWYGSFSKTSITRRAFEIDGTTRVWVLEPECSNLSTPFIGQVVVAFMRDGDSNPFPSQQDIDNMKDYLTADNYMPANQCEKDVLVISPIKQTINFTFSRLSPDSPEIRDAIEANLRQMFLEEVDFMHGLQEDLYRCAIQNAINPITGEKILDFELANPVGDIDVNLAGLMVLGEVKYELN